MTELPIPAPAWVRIRAAWACLRGHSVAYRCDFRTPVTIDCHGLSFRGFCNVFPGPVEWHPTDPPEYEKLDVAVR